MRSLYLGGYENELDLNSLFNMILEFIITRFVESILSLSILEILHQLKIKKNLRHISRKQSSLYIHVSNE